MLILTVKLNVCFVLLRTKNRKCVRGIKLAFEIYIVKATVISLY